MSFTPFIDMSYPKLPETSVEGKEQNRRLLIPVIFDLSILSQGILDDVKFILAPGTSAEDVRLIAQATVNQHPILIGRVRTMTFVQL